MISFRQSDLLRSLEKSEELPEVHLSVDVSGGNILEVDLIKTLMFPSEMKSTLTARVQTALFDVGFYLAADGTISWAVNGESDESNVDQIAHVLSALKESFKSVGFKIYDHIIEDPSEMISGRIATFILELPK
jgi:hypothetical protein